MTKEYTSLGLMSGTSGDGVDASIIKSDGNTYYEGICDKYYEYDDQIYKDIHELKQKILNTQDLNTYTTDLKSLEKKITLFHAKVIKDISKNIKIDLVGFHGQTIYHNSYEKISKQLGEGNLLLQLTQKNIVYNFRLNDIKNGGEGAPLAPIFHKLIATQLKLSLPICILNIGGISNLTIIGGTSQKYNFKSQDIGPGNCLIDSWVRKNSEYKFDKDGSLAARGNRDEIIFETGNELFSNRTIKSKSFDVNDFDVSFARGLSLEDGATTLTDFTAEIITSYLLDILKSESSKYLKILVCGGGRKNKTLINKIKQKVKKSIIIENIDEYGINGDFIESQAFAFLAIRSLLNLPISFPETTGCQKPSTGGEIIKIT